LERFVLNRLLSVCVLAFTLSGLGGASVAEAAPLSQAEREEIAATMGSNTAKQYCGGYPLGGAMEKGMMQTFLSRNLEISMMDQIDLDDKEIGIAFFENLFADAFKLCPGKARAIWRQMAEM
jgi:hypothetical protein